VASYLVTYFKDVKRILLVHLNSADSQTIKNLEEGLPQAAVVLCHRSNLFLGYHRTNWNSLENLQIPLLLGTDSVASSPDLSILDEILSIMVLDKIPAANLWKAATYQAYRYFNIPLSDVPFFWFPGTTPDISSLVHVTAVNITH